MAVPAWLAAMFAAKYLPLWLGGAMAGQTVVGEIGRAGERKHVKEQLAIQNLLAGKTAEAGKKETEATRKRTEAMVKRLMKERAVEASKERETQLLQAFMGSQQQQMNDILQVIQASRQGPFTGGAGMVGLMRQG